MNNIFKIIVLAAVINSGSVFSMSKESLLPELNPEAPSGVMRNFIKTKSENDFSAVLNLLELIKESEPENYDAALNIFQAELDKFSPELFKKFHDITFKFYQSKLKEIDSKLNKVKADSQKIDNMLSKIPARENLIKDIEDLGKRLQTLKNDLMRSQNLISTLSTEKLSGANIKTSNIDDLAQENKQLAAKNKILQYEVETLRKEIREAAKPKKTKKF